MEQLTEVVKLQDDKTHNENDIIKILDSFLEVEEKLTEDVEDTTTGEVEDKISEEVENETSEEGSKMLTILILYQTTYDFFLYLINLKYSQHKIMHAKNNLIFLSCANFFVNIPSSKYLTLSLL